MDENILQFSKVSKSFNDFQLKNLTFSLPKGFIMGLIGHNGAGKTTTIKLILNMIKKSSGEIKVFGKDNSLWESEIKEKIGVVLDEHFYLDEWTLADVEKAIAPFYFNWDKTKYSHFLQKFSLSKKKKVKELSRGMRMKLMIACALSHDAQLLILDEPTSGLDALARNDLMEILSEFIQDENKGVLFSTHITQDLEKIADYITFIGNGEILYTGTKDNLLEKYLIVKGELGILSENEKKSIVGYHENGLGFDGIVDTAAASTLPKSVIFEKCNFDEIVIRFNSKGERK